MAGPPSQRVLAQAFAGLVFLLAALTAAVFVPAGRLDDWRAWAALCVFGAATLAITIDLAIRDRELLARRTRVGPLAEPRLAQKLVQTFAGLAFLAVFIIGGLDHRHGWSRVPGALSIVGDVLIAAGLGVVAVVFRANTFTAATIQVDQGQQLISTGPYAVVRHPMYAGALVMLIGLPLALGSWWSNVPVAALAAIIAWRATDEERVLVASLPGYAEYRTKVRARLIPGVW
jgi:protein-S-isoprenylcysteine O-methyltransferase Ste14